jgi:hypothetical protein
MARVQAERSTTGQASGQFQPAPTPNQSVMAPHDTLASGPVLRPSLFRQSNTYHGEGYTPGSQQVTQEPRRLPVPGFNLKVPLN